VSALCFAIGFAVLYFSGLWTKLLQWADAPFMFYFAILAPVLFGFTMYGIYLAFAKLFGWERKRRPAHPAPSEKEPGA